MDEQRRESVSLDPSRSAAVGATRCVLSLNAICGVPECLEFSAPGRAEAMPAGGRGGRCLERSGDQIRSDDFSSRMSGGGRSPATRTLEAGYTAGGAEIAGPLVVRTTSAREFHDVLEAGRGTWDAAT
jgi:hypothetical protein